MRIPQILRKGNFALLLTYSLFVVVSLFLAESQLSMLFICNQDPECSMLFICIRCVGGAKQSIRSRKSVLKSAWPPKGWVIHPLRVTLCAQPGISPDVKFCADFAKDLRMRLYQSRPPPTPCVYQIQNDDIRTLKILYSMSEFDGMREK